MTAEKSNAEQLQDIGRNAYECIAEMVAALQCDRERLVELRDALADWTLEGEEDCPEPSNDILRPDGTTPRHAAWAEENPDDAEELAALEAAVTIDGDELTEDEARDRIMEDPLSVQVRSGWYTPGDRDADTKPAEFEILLSTGGPATRIMGELDSNGEPYRAWLEAQDWFQPWTQYFDADQDTLLTYARCFYFGD